MSDNNIGNAFALEESDAAASSLSLPAAQERARQLHQRHQIVLLSSIGLVTSAAVLGILSYRSGFLSAPAPGIHSTSPPIKGVIASMSNGILMTPSPEWQKMVAAIRGAKTKGVFLDITYPSSNDKRRVWQQGPRWRDETKRRVYGFDGTQEWVWFPKTRQLIAWKQKRAKLNQLKYTGLRYTRPNLLRFLQDTDSAHPDLVPEFKSSLAGKELQWRLEQQDSETKFSLSAETHLPLTEKFTLKQNPLWENSTIYVSDFGSNSTPDETSWEYVYRVAPPSFMTFARTPAFRKELREPAGTIRQQPTPAPTAPPLSSKPKQPMVVHTVRASYGVLPHAGFGVPKGIPVIDLDQISATWQARLKKGQVATIEAPKYQAIIRHASQDSQGNVYLIYTGDSLEPEMFRKQLKVILAMPGYDTLSWRDPSEVWPSDLGLILPPTLERKPLRHLVLMPLKPGARAARSLTLRVTEEDVREGGTRSRDIAIPLVQEPKGPECMTAISGLPTAAIRNSALIQTFRAAVSRASGQKIQPETVASFETIAKDNWGDNLPWKVALYLGRLSEIGGNPAGAYSYAARAMTGYKQPTAHTTTTNLDTLEYEELQQLLTRLDK